MTHTDRLPPDDPREWLNRARSSLLHAQARTLGVRLDDLCFDAQQAAEKAIKAVLVAREVRFPYVHDLAALLAMLEKSGYQVSGEIREAAAAAFHDPDERYPHLAVITEAEYEHTLAAARLLVAWAEGEVSAWRGGTRRVHEPPAVRYASDPVDTLHPDPALLAEVASRIAAAVQPRRIILFGSGARGTMGPHSDLDLLIEMSELPEERVLRRRIRDALLDLPVPIDIVLATPEILERYRDSWCLVYCPAQEEGRVIYEQERGFVAAGEDVEAAAGSRNVAQTGR